MAAVKNIKRQITVTAIIAMEKAAFLAAMQRIIGGVDIEDNALGRELPPFSGPITNRIVSATGTASAQG